MSKPGADTAAIDEQLWARFGGDAAVMFTDLAGFSERSQERGITHFLRLIHEKRSIMSRVAADYGGTLIKVEADSVLAVFDTARAALDCALAMQQACQQASADLPGDDALLLCVGLGYGRVLRVGNSDVWGTQVNAASKLGEDFAKAHEVLVTSALRQAVGDIDVTFSIIDVELPGARTNYLVTT